MSETEKSTVATARAERAYLARSRYRYRFVCLGFAVAFLLVGSRLVVLGFTGAEPNQGGVYDISTTVHRPDILDRRGRLLATDIKGATVYADPKRVIDEDELVEQVATVLPDIKTAELRQRLKNGRRFVSIQRELTPKQQAELYELGLPGLGFVQEYRRVYPVGATASHVVGYVDVDNKGLSGIEQFVDDNPQLAMSHAGSAVGEDTVTLSLDLGVQHVLREELKSAVATFHAKAASGMVMDVHSGEVLALASLPDYDPNRREQALDKNRINRIGSRVYEMGSVFKIFTVAGALDGGVATMRSSYDATNPIKVGSFSISDFHGKKRSLTVPEIFIYSSNIGSAKIALDMGTERHRAFLKKLGLLGRIRTELGYGPAPIIPAHWQRLNTMTIAFGHGLSVTPLQLAASALPLVNGGIGVTPTFLPRSREEAMSVSPRVLKASTSESMLKLMRLNVLKGTAKRAEAVGYRVGGKTGTAEKVVGGRYNTSALLTSFLAAFPTDAPAYLVLVMLDEPQRVAASSNQATAGVNAAPTARKIIERIAPILGVAPKLDADRPAFDGKVTASY
ncbi:MAG: peptidoglycan D,D-transpeptidase FtsI family protein [Methyloceanibacter sp.]|uniref:peptidoglycan D,D-transpeptidase FtsI family protein n=1 Tax=Methyloceanibacter sp. TaxID=1965321 RepID=UPI003D9B4B9C